MVGLWGRAVKIGLPRGAKKSILDFVRGLSASRSSFETPRLWSHIYPTSAPISRPTRLSSAWSAAGGGLLLNFDRPQNNFAAALSRYASWGCLDIGQNNYRDGYQSPPVDWGLSPPRKRGFYDLVREITAS